MGILIITLLGSKNWENIPSMIFLRGSPAIFCAQILFEIIYFEEKSQIFYEIHSYWMFNLFTQIRLKTREQPLHKKKIAKLRTA